MFFNQLEMTTSEEVNLALETIKQNHELSLSMEHSSCLLELINDYQGFSSKAIALIRSEVSKMEFALPTHISILEKGKSSSNIFELVPIYSNSQKLQAIFEEKSARTLLNAYSANWQDSAYISLG